MNRTIPILANRNGEWVKEQYTLTAEELAAMEAEEAAGREAARRDEVERLKAQLAESDYRVIKCSEAMLAGLPMPYDVKQLHAERQAIRDQINAFDNQ